MVISNTDLGRRLRRESDRDIVPMKLCNSGGGKVPDFWHAFDEREDQVIGDEPGNTGKDQGDVPSHVEKAKRHPVELRGLCSKSKTVIV
jgi:hypothetical protein